MLILGVSHIFVYTSIHSKIVKRMEIHEEPFGTSSHCFNSMYIKCMLKDYIGLFRGFFNFLKI